MTTETVPDARMSGVTIEEEMRASYLSYAMSVIVSRALPDVRDGLKPVQRRILYAMHDMGVRAGGQHRKSARIVGEVLGKFHPHGDSSVYDALVRMAQPFSMRMMLVDGQGNFGSVDGDPAAAMRYTEARMAAITAELMADIDEDTVDHAENFDDSLEEPVVLPARVPNLLVNGSSGIAVGMATNMPPHNLGEICDAVCMLLERPESDLDALMTVIKGPDFPTSGVIRGGDGIREMYANGRGKVPVEGVSSIEETSNGRQRIVITELPYQVNKANLVEKIAGLVKDKVVQGVSDIRDESDRTGMRIVIELARGAQAKVILNNLYRRTALRSNFNAIMLALVDGQPQELPLKSLLEHFITHRMDVIRRRTIHRLAKARERAEVIDGLLMALDQIDSVIETIRNSPDVERARSGLITGFNLTERQAQAILDMQLRRLAALERKRLEEERQALSESIDELEQILASEDRVKEVIKDETRALQNQYADARKTRLESAEVAEQDYQDLVVEESVVITVTQKGYIKRVPVNTYRSQRRGGKGVKAADSRDDDALMQVEVLSTHDRLLFFTNEGRVYPLQVHQMPADASRTGRGTLLINMISLQGDERVRTMLPMRQKGNERLLLFGTKNGRIKVMATSELENLTAKGMRATVLNEGDELVDVRFTSEEHEILMVSRDGQAITFPVESLRPQRRLAKGVTGMRLKLDDQVIATDVVTDPKSDHIMAVSEGGMGKATPIHNNRGERIYPLSRRGTQGVRTFMVDNNRNSRRYTGPVVDACVVSTPAVSGDEDYGVFIISDQGQMSRIDLSDIKVTNTRHTRGVVVWRERLPGDRVASIACFKGEENEPEDDGTEVAAVDNPELVEAEPEQAEVDDGTEVKAAQANATEEAEKESEPAPEPDPEPEREPEPEPEAQKDGGESPKTESALPVTDKSMPAGQMSMLF